MITPEEAAKLLNEYLPNERKWTAQMVRVFMQRDKFKPAIGATEHKTKWTYWIREDALMLHIITWTKIRQKIKEWRDAA